MFRLRTFLEKYGTYDVISYILSKLGGEIRGVKKLMKLVFLIQYERKNDIIVKYSYGKKPLTRAEFYIWNYGPMSNEVYQVIDERLEIYDKKAPVIIKLPDFARPRKLPEPVVKRVDYILNKYGNLHGFELERVTLEMLELDEFRKTEYMGVLVDDYIREVFGKDKLNVREIA